MPRRGLMINLTQRPQRFNIANIAFEHMNIVQTKLDRGK